MRREFMLLVCGLLMLTLLLPFQAAAESDTAVLAENSKSGVTMVAGGRHTFALNENGTVWAWGSNERGQLGEGSTSESSTPVQVQGLSSVTAIALGESHSLAIKSDGTVWAWGSNDYGQLGDGSTTERHTPIQVEDLGSVIGIAANYAQSLALKSDGTVWAWGNNASGQLGDGTTIDRYTPVQVQGLDSVIAVSAGNPHSLALKNDGTVWAWGRNDIGQLGNGSSIDSVTPVQVQGLSSVAAIASGWHHNLAIKSDGTAWAWGTNFSGELGDGSYYPQYTPVQVQNLSSVIDVAAGYGHSLALKSDGTVWVWGNHDFDPRGYGNGWPVQVQDLSSVVDIAAGSQHSMAVKGDGTVWTWGKNDFGQLGDGTKTARFIPLQVQFGAPEWPEGDGLTVTDVTYSSVRLNWQPATDETGVDKYLVYQENTLLATLNGDANNYEVKGLSSNSSYLFSLIAVDADGNQSVKKDVTVTTAGTKDETLLFQVDGTIVDFDQNRILWIWKSPTLGEALWLYDRRDKSQVKVDDATGYDLSYRSADLTADGVVYSMSTRGGNFAVYWKDGAYQPWEYHESWGIPLDVNGNIVLFDGLVANLTTNTHWTNPTHYEFPETVQYDLLADGTVVYTDPMYTSGPYKLYKLLPDGTLTSYEPSGNYQAYSGALTDGKNIVYKALTLDSKWELQVRGADDEIMTLTHSPDSESDHRAAYRINNGWIAFKEYDADKDRWILYVRSPEGAKKQVFATPGDGTPLAIKKLAPDGTVAYTFKGSTSLYSAEESKLLYSFSGSGELQDRDGEWYRIDGSSLFQIHPYQLQLSDSKTYQEGGSNYKFALYYGYISSPGHELSGFWSPPEGFHGVVKVSMVSPEGEDYDLSLETVGEGKRLPVKTTKSSSGAENSAAEVQEGYAAVWRIKGHSDDDYSPDKKVFVYVNIQYDNR
ncbi:fibronectin type III domain-containing protein [Paenibacillus harenae]|uniref:RCC1 domain-containing protein n=1 Tax=Paenibacillus harenae TaxID=306543 RepID=UPI0004141F24|nr:fibronectin type III domain-containing protein [Paenibacillus harenae]